ncbi:Starch-binding associating with outer membrane [Mariniphaga anaerophila]|uniref:Starch-binding associating with outer membrane n=1 Tax=Mariniphaga anaerophila TaxID=1484053 RepID=A0A1M5BTP1_9BACT|nr:RagB/SusD family nutrient uptake outer membrane protein [Mariniphaga anaerophila]SHF45701.1 Starch-binding associating with outer membrane [Mariniphaga anaerophila]
MKRIYNIFIIVLLLSVFTGCDKFLEEDPRDIISPLNYYQTDEEVMAGVNGLYNNWYDDQLFNNYGILRFYNWGTDEIEPSRAGTGGLAQLCMYNLYEDQQASSVTWRVLYKIIYDANVLIGQISNNDQISEAVKNQALGEALFNRAFAFYHLTNIFGDVPYYRENLPLDEIQFLGRHDKNNIRNEIVEDLQQAQDVLPDIYTGDDRGRASKWAAATLMVKINLIQQNWKAARDKAVEIINNSPHKLRENYKDVFDPLNEFHEENIFQIVYTKDINPQKFGNHFSPRLRDEPAKSKQRDDLEAALTEQGEVFDGTGLEVVMQDLRDKFPLDDLRRPMTICDNYLGFDLKFIYMPKYWALDFINSPRGNHGKDWVIFRLADVYLMAAEAENELNGPANAYQYINKVRERAYEPDKPLSGLSQQKFREAMYDERKWELAGEGHRKMDLIRWGILLDVVQKLENTTYPMAENIRPYHTLWPLPAEELMKNPTLLESDPTNNGYR